MTPSIPPAVVQFLSRGDAKDSFSAGLVVLAVLLAALAAGALLQTAGPRAPRDRLRLFGIVAVPLLVVFVAVVAKRFHDLS